MSLSFAVSPISFPLDRKKQLVLFFVLLRERLIFSHFLVRFVLLIYQYEDM